MAILKSGTTIGGQEALHKGNFSSMIGTGANQAAAGNHSHSQYVNQNAFSNIAVSGQTTVAADTATDTLTLAAGTNISITTDATNDKITIANTYSYTHPSTHPASMITGLATVATSGSYNDLTNKPSLGTAASKNTGTASGQVPLIGSDGKLPTSVIPAVAITDTFVVATEVEMLALTAQRGDVAVRSDLKKTFILKTDDASLLANWVEVLTPANGVQSVNGKTGSAVTLNASDVGARASSWVPAWSDVTGKPSASTTVAGIVQLSDATNSTSTTQAATANAVKKAYDLANGKANASHGNHVPAVETANNAKFLRNDNTWQLVTPANIGALAASATAVAANKLATARTINGVSFDGSANITITAAANGGNSDTVDNLHASSFLRSDAANSTDLRFGSADGRGIRFWDNDNSKIYMAASTNATLGGRFGSDITSDYNMYFKMASGTNRGFVFKNGTDNVASIDSTGNVKAKGGISIGSDAFSLVYDADSESVQFIFA